MTKKTLILASGSPRRAMLLEALSFPFLIEPTHASEELPIGISTSEAALLLARRKAHAHEKSGDEHAVILAADTVVVLDGMILNKPGSREEAFEMLHRLSGNTHSVITGFCLTCGNKEYAADETSKVTFRNLSKAEIEHYINEFQPMDKAGAYGIQESMPIGMDPCSTEEKHLLISLGRPELPDRCREISSDRKPVVLIQHLNGSFFNVMGLPLAKLADPLRQLLQYQ